MKALIMNILYISTNNMNQVYSTKKRTTLIITNSDATQVLTFKQNRERKTIEVYSVTDSQKNLLFTLNTHEAMKAISDFLIDSIKLYN